MDYTEAKALADRIKTDLAPFCERIEIAGSIRRLKQADIKDVEIVCIPKLEPVTDMFGMVSGNKSVLEKALPEIIKEWNAWSVKNGDKFKQFVFPGGRKLDLFIVTAESWGVQLAIRTGPAEYSKWLVTSRRFYGALPSYAKVEGGRVLVHGKPIETPEEVDFFSFLGVPMLEPHQRRLSETLSK